MIEALLAPLVDPASRTFLPALIVSALVAGAFVARTGGGWRAVWAPHLWRTGSSRLDLQLVVVRQLLGVLRVVPELGGGLALALALVALLDRAFGVPALTTPPGLTAAYTIVLFVASDASRYALHRLLHRSDVLWQFHQVHHSAEVLTPLTFHRIHPVEEALYAARGALVGGLLGGLAFWLFRGALSEGTVLGVNAIGLAFNAVTGNIRHSHVWMRFGDRAERWLLSPAQHQLHHGREAADNGSNFGTWLALWDRLGATLRISPREAVPVGLHPADRNHAPDDLVGALARPFLPISAAGLRLVAVGALALGRAARAEEPVEPDEDAAYQVVVEAESGIPRVAGSAYVIGEAELERFEYDDIHRVIARVPGVYVRGEDGFGLRPNIGMRGGNSDRSAKIVLLEDGILMAPAPYAAPAAYYFPMTTRMVGVEVFKGPAAIRYGPQTIGGAINLITRPIPVEPDGGIDVGIGGYGTVKAHAWGGTAGRVGGVLLESSNLTSEGFKTLDTGGPTGFQRQDLMLKTRIGTRANRVELKLEYGRERSYETYLGLSATDFEADPYRRYAATELDEMNWNRFGEELSWTARPGPEFEVRTVLYHHALYRVWTKFSSFAGGTSVHDLLQTEPGGQSAVLLAILRGEEDSVTADQMLQIGTNDRTFHNGGVQTVLKYRRLEVGVRAHADAVMRLHTEDPFAMTSGRLVPTGGDTLVTLDSVTEARALASWAQNDFAFGPVHLVPGFRVEVIRTAAGTPETGVIDPVTAVVALPGGAALVRPVDWLDVYAGVHRGFSPVAPGSPPEEAPETAVNYELGTRASPGETHAELVGFFSDYANITGQCTLSGGCSPDQVDQQFSGGAAQVYGLESLLAHIVRLPGGWSLQGDLSYTLTQTRFQTGFVSEFPQFGTVEAGDAMPYVPTHQGAARVTALGERGSLAVGANARGAMRDVAGQGEIPVATGIPPALLLDAAAEVVLGRDVRLYATATNLAHAVVLESWEPYGARPAAPFQVMVGLKSALPGVQ